MRKYSADNVFCTACGKVLRNYDSDIGDIDVIRDRLAEALDNFTDYIGDFSNDLDEIISQGDALISKLTAFFQ